MSLYPSPVLEPMNNSSVSKQPNRTYYLDFLHSTVAETIDGEKAIRQAIHKALITNIARPRIYDGTYGSELETLIGTNHSLSYLQSEVPRMVADALIYDDRIDAVEGVQVSVNGDMLFISFLVVLTNKTKLDITEAVRY